MVELFQFCRPLRCKVVQLCVADIILHTPPGSLENKSDRILNVTEGSNNHPPVGALCEVLFKVEEQINPKETARPAEECHSSHPAKVSDNATCWLQMRTQVDLIICFFVFTYFKIIYLYILLNKMNISLVVKKKKKKRKQVPSSHIK